MYATAIAFSTFTETSIQYEKLIKFYWSILILNKMQIITRGPNGRLLLVYYQLNDGHFRNRIGLRLVCVASVSFLKLLLFLLLEQVFTGLEAWSVGDENVTEYSTIFRFRTEIFCIVLQHASCSWFKYMGQIKSRNGRADLETWLKMPR